MKLLVRRVRGSSMEPLLKDGGIVLLVISSGVISVGTIAILEVHGTEIIKIIEKIDQDKVWYRGANTASTDSRDVGWVTHSSIKAKLLWPLRRKNRVKAFL